MSWRAQTENHCNHVAEYYLERFATKHLGLFRNLYNYYARLSWGYSK